MASHAASLDRNLGIALFGSGSGVSHEGCCHLIAWLEREPELQGSHEPSKWWGWQAGVFVPQHKDISISAAAEYLLTQQLTSTRADSPGSHPAKTMLLLWLSLEESNALPVLEHLFVQRSILFMSGLHRDTQESEITGATLETSSN